MNSEFIVTALSALAQDTRLSVFRLLVTAGPDGLTPGKIADQLGLPPATLSFHLKELNNAGLIVSRQESRFIHYSADYKTMNRLVAFLTENCCSGVACETSPAEICNPGKKR